MKLVMTLLVRNEDDIIEENLLFHRAMGVDTFVVTDHKSTDGTTDILLKYKKEGWVDLLFESTDTYNQGVWVSEMARRAYTEHGADWVINNDADEFWVPPTGTLKDYLEGIPSDVGTLHVNRLDFHYRPFNNAAFYEALLFREWVCKWTKCCHRGVPDVSVEIGNHNAYSKELSGRYPRSISAMNALKVLHYPIRSYERYFKKMVDGAGAMLNTPGISAESGFHWKNALKQIQEGTFEGSFEEKVYSQDRIMQGIKNGNTVMDDSIQRFFLGKKL